jgi:DNA-directed RNA polymerase sigma subunit (sigma70/sigma32)
MNATELIDAIEASGGRFVVDGEKVVITPHSAAPMKLREQLIKHKQAILKLLSRRSDPPLGPAKHARMDRKRAIIHDYDSGGTLQQVGDKYHLTRQRVQQIVSAAQPMRDRQRAQRDLYASYIRDYLEMMGDREVGKSEEQVNNG